MQNYTKHFFGHETLSWRQKLLLTRSISRGPFKISGKKRGKKKNRNAKGNDRKVCGLKTDSRYLAAKLFRYMRNKGSSESGGHNFIT